MHLHIKLFKGNQAGDCLHVAATERWPLVQVSLYYAFKIIIVEYNYYCNKDVIINEWQNEIILNGCQRQMTCSANYVDGISNTVEVIL